MDNRSISKDPKISSDEDARKKWDDDTPKRSSKRVVVERKKTRVFTDWASI